MTRLASGFCVIALLTACDTRREAAVKTLARNLPPVRRISVEVRSRPARDAIQDIAREAGWAIDLAPGLGLDPVTLSLREVTPFEALDAVCAEHKNLSYKVSSWSKLMFFSKTPADLATTYVRQYRVRAIGYEQYGLVPGSPAALRLEILGPPDASAFTHMFLMHEGVDDLGNPLLALDPDAWQRWHMNRRHHGMRDSTLDEFIPLKPPLPGARRVARLRGSAIFYYPQEELIVSFPEPSKSVGKSVTRLGMTFTLADFKAAGTSYSVSVTCKGDFEPLRTPLPGDDASRGLRTGIGTDDIELVTESGVKPGFESSGGSGGKDEITCVFGFRSTAPEKVKEIRIRCTPTYYTDRIDFELRDFELPK